MRRTMLFCLGRGTFLRSILFCPDGLTLRPVHRIPQSNARHRRWEATMDLSMRLNILAALLSFGFVAAIAVGAF